MNGGRSNRAAHCASRTICTRSPGRSNYIASSGTSRPTTGAPPATPPAATPSPRRAPAATGHPITNNEIPVPDGQAIIDLELGAFGEVKPDLSLELRIETLKLTFDLLVELDLTSRPSYNREKLLAYDAFLCGWSLAHPRYRSQATRPAVVFVCPNAHAATALARGADQALTGRIGAMGAQAEHWVPPRTRPHLLRDRSRHPPRRPRSTHAPRTPARATRTPDRNPRAGARARHPAAHDAHQTALGMM
ncbi:MAG: hypothetical protein WBP81_17750 [Solirubrobacteraceae bacterium]